MEKGKKKVANRIWNIVTTALLVIMILLVATMYIPKLFGLEPMIVLSGSMEPKYPVGSLLYIDKVEQKDIEVGDPITFYISDKTLVTHRVVAINDDGTYVTKGDANDIEDGSPVKYDSVIGSPVFHIVKLGFLADKLSHTSGKIVYGTVVIVVVVLMLMGDYIFSDEESKSKKKEKSDDENEEK